MNCLGHADFVSVRKPNIAVASADQMLSITADDVFRKLRFLFTAVCCLCGIMVVGAAVAGVQSVSAKRRVVALCKKPEFGFSDRGGVWTWNLQQEPLEDEVGTVMGSAVELCRALGLPFVRFRAAVPEEWFGGAIAQAVGRKAGLSPKIVESLGDRIREHWRDLASSGAGCCGGGRTKIPELELGDPSGGMPHATGGGDRRGSHHLARFSTAAGWAAAGEALKEADEEEFRATLVGTALMFAFFGVSRLLSLPVLAERMREAAEFFGDEAQTFMRLRGKFATMLGEETLHDEDKWLTNVRGSEPWRAQAKSRARCLLP